LLDTHILLWWLADDEHLSARGRELIANPEHVVFYSAASIWEIRIKAAIGKLDLPDTFADALAAQAFEALSVTAAHAHMLRDLPLLHRDPFDRMLVSQARAEHLTLVTHDEVLTRYDVTSLRV
jgi:PIN domain nuclease of toxin-antitoxin system